MSEESGAEAMVKEKTSAPDILQDKFCPGCKETKSTSSFSVSKGRAGGEITAYCKICLSKRNREYRLKYYRELRLKRYDLTLKGYEEILESQEGKCAICRSPDPKSNGKFCVDHDHKTGKTRGILCVNCNWALGNAQDSIEILSSCIIYLEKHRQDLARDEIREI